jgi:hypothetical protein
MEPARYALRFSETPGGLLHALQAVLEGQGSPAIQARGNGLDLEFVSETGDFMLRARVADALSTVWPYWQAAIR